MAPRSIDFRLYLVTDRMQLPATRNAQPATRTLLSAVKRALSGGVRAVQLREKDLGTRDLLKLAYRMRSLTEKYGARLFINDRFDVALAVRADGVHLTQQSIPAHAVRSAVGRKLLIGVSTHSLKEAREAEKGGADFITLGPVYRTPSKLKYGPPAGLDTLKRVCRAVGIPVFAIGGVRGRRIKEVQAAGAYGAAMISGILGEGDIRKKAEELTLLTEKL
ncbi:MAG: thiamine phosphate synthase [Deferribacteres bacterium]|nr:thiamine phosphate synthase [Deferribacteres bacterium]